MKSTARRRRTEERPEPEPTMLFLRDIEAAQIDRKLAEAGMHGFEWPEIVTTRESSEFFHLSLEAR